MYNELLFTLNSSNSSPVDVTSALYLVARFVARAQSN